MADLRSARVGVRGFTLLELLVTIAIVALLATVAIPNLTSAMAARNASAISESFVQDAAWVRTQAVAGHSPASVTLQSDCSWTASIDGQTDGAHSLSARQVASQYPGASCTGLPAQGLSLSYGSTGLVAMPAGSTTAAATTVRFRMAGNPQAPQTLFIYGSGVIIWGADVAS